MINYWSFDFINQKINMYIEKIEKDLNDNFEDCIPTNEKDYL